MLFAGRRCVIGAVCLAVLILFAFHLVPLCFAVSFDEAAEAVGRAEYDLGSAFVAVAEAEDAGADVSVLLDKLEAAGVFLSEAHSAFRVGNYESAFSYASACNVAVAGVADEAASLRLDAEKARSNQLVFAVVGSGVGLVLLSVLGFFGWRLLKKWYFKRVLDMKPDLGVAE